MCQLLRAGVITLALSAAVCVTQSALAQNLQPSGLPARGAVQGTDVIVDQPAGSSTVQGAQASAIATYVQQTAAPGSSGQVVINSAGAFAGVTVSGDATLASSGALTVAKSNGTAFGTFAFQNYASLPAATGSPPISSSTVFPCIPASALDGCTGTQLLAYVSNGPIGADPTGSADSTSALQSWLSAGAPGTLPCGTYKTTATLTMQALANSGQQVRGSGAGSSAGGGGCRTVIQPTSAVTTALLIDGTPTSVWTMGMGIHNLAIDMVNMTDSSSTAAIKQIKSYDVIYDNVRVLNYGSNKRAWLLNGGAFTTTFLNVQGGIIDLEGTSSSLQVTTVTIINPDIQALIANQVANLRVLGGAITAFENGTAVTLSNAAEVNLMTDLEGDSTTTAYNLGSNITGLTLADSASLTYPGGSYMTGTPPAIGYFNFDIGEPLANYPASIGTQYVRLNCQALSTCYSSFLSGSNSVNSYLYVGRANGESVYGVAAAANAFLSGTAAGDTVLTSNASGEATWIGAAGSPVAKFSTSGVTLQSGVALTASTSPQTFTSGSSSTDEYIYLGLTGGSTLLGVAAGTNHLVSGTVSGDAVFGSNASGQHTFLNCGGNPCWKGDSYGHQYTQGYPAPSAGTGTSSAAGNDNAFTVTAGSSVTSSAVSFGGTWSVTPKCTATANTSSAFPYISAVSTTALTLGWSASVSGAVATVHCEG